MTKTKEILYRAWNEPSQFFLWLALFSLCGFAAMIFLASFGAGSIVVGFIALACAACFLLSLPAWILAWIPPVRRWLTRVLRHRFLALVCLFTLAALFYAVEDWRGRHAWQEFKRIGEAKGERYDQASFFPPPVPADQNFFETPLWTDLKFTYTNGRVDWSGTTPNRVVFDAYGPKGGTSGGDWANARRTDLSAWQSYYRGSNNLFAARGGVATNYFPIAKEPQTAAADILLALSKWETNRQLLIAEAVRPKARFWANYEAGFGTAMPHLTRVKAASVYSSFHANAALGAGGREMALQDIKLSFRLIATIRDEPTLISQLVRVAMFQIALQPVWEGLADRKWTEADLNALESELARLDFLADYQFGLRSERNRALWTVDWIHSFGYRGLRDLGVTGDGDSTTQEVTATLARALFVMVPNGWFDQNKLSLGRNFQNFLLPAVDLNRRVVSPVFTKDAEVAIAQPARWPYDVLSQLLLPAAGRVAAKLTRAQTSADLARLACALERHRLATGQFPETLEALVPKYVEQLPHDLITGQPLKYRRTGDGQFVLYSVGWNQTDDGGRVGLTKSGQSDPNQGDWVWQYPTR